MSVVIHFAPELGGWVRDGFARGRTPVALVETMVAERMDVSVARAIVSAFAAAARGERPVPVDSITLEDAHAEYVHGASRLPRGSRIETPDGQRVRVLARSERPVVAVLDGVLVPDECAALVALARPRLRPSTVTDPQTGRDVVAAHRTSLGTFLRPAETPLVAALDARVSALMGLPTEHGEGFQILKYAAGAESTPHFDFLAPTSDTNRASVARSGQRVSSLVIYLNDVDDGGETLFPLQGWSISPHAGGAVYFEYANALGQVDELSLHAGGKVLAGEKWVATKWMRERPFWPY